MTNKTELMPDMIWAGTYDITGDLDVENPILSNDWSASKMKGATCYVRADGHHAASVHVGIDPAAGFVLMPRTHTQAMTDAVRGHVEHIGHAGVSMLTVGWYDALIAAAPKQVTKTPENVSCDLASNAGETTQNRTSPFLRRFTDQYGNKMVEVVEWFYDQMVSCLETESAPVDPDALKREISEGPDASSFSPDFKDGWRICIDELHSRGLIRCLSNSEKSEHQTGLTVTGEQQGSGAQ